MGSSSPPQSAAAAEDRRYHSLDQLRAVMMLLGLVIHSTISFVTKSRGAEWPYQDASTSALFDILVFFIHVFRMPLFFLMAGFFTALLYYRRGAWEMVRNRGARVAIPFALFLAVLFPLVKSGFLFSVGGGVNGGWEAARAYLADPAGWYVGLRTIHLWFLYYLIQFYVLIALAMPLAERIAGSRANGLGTRLGKLIHHPLGVLIGIATTFLTLLPMRSAGLDTETFFLVQPRILLAYGVFVGFGWVLYLNRQAVDGFATRAWLWMAVGVLLSCGYLGYMLSLRGEFLLAGNAGRLLAAAAMWTLIYGFIGLFVRYYDHPKPLGRYLADASYWMFLIHLPITIWVPGLMNGWHAHAVLKSAITLAVTTLVTVATYDLFVRSTAVGAFLNGKRYPRGLPEVVVPSSRLAESAGSVEVVS